MGNVVELDRRYRRRVCCGKTFEALCVLHNLKKLDGLTRDEQLVIEDAIQIVHQLANKLESEEAQK